LKQSEKNGLQTTRMSQANQLTRHVLITLDLPMDLAKSSQKIKLLSASRKETPEDISLTEKRRDFPTPRHGDVEKKEMSNKSLCNKAFIIFIE